MTKIKVTCNSLSSIHEGVGFIIPIPSIGYVKSNRYEEEGKNPIYRIMIFMKDHPTEFNIIDYHETEYDMFLNDIEALEQQIKWHQIINIKNAKHDTFLDDIGTLKARKLDGIIELKGDVKTKPSDFLNYPYGSIAGTAEEEIVARNIMVILNRTGNTFRELSWNEYKEHILKDRDPWQGKDVAEKEKGYFESVLHFCTSAEAAKSFSSDWTNCRFMEKSIHPNSTCNDCFHQTCKKKHYDGIETLR